MKKYATSPLIVLLITVLATGLIAGCITITPQQPQQPADTSPPVIDTPPQGPPSIISFETSSGEIAEGESATLTWEVTGADTVTIVPGIGDVPQSGSIDVSPGEGTIYTLTAVNTVGDASRSVGINISGTMTPQSIALTEADVGPNGFVFVSTSVPKDYPNAVAAYSIKFKRGDEELVNTVATFSGPNNAINYYFLSKEPYRTADAWPIYTINDQMAYVIISKGNPEEPNSDKYDIRLTKNNVFAEVGYINNYKELEGYARLLETRIK
jgi:hypothetical protein